MSQQSEIEQVSSWGGSESWVRTLDANLKSLQEANKFYSEVVRLQHLNLGWFQENFMRGGQSLFVALEFVERGRIFFSRSVKIGTRKYDCLPAKTAKELLGEIVGRLIGVQRYDGGFVDGFALVLTEVDGLPSKNLQAIIPVGEIKRVSKVLLRRKSQAKIPRKLHTTYCGSYQVATIFKFES